MMYNIIEKSLIKVLPENWEEVVMYSHMKNYGYEIFFYVKVGDRYIGCFNMGKKFGISTDEVMECFDKIYETLYPDFIEKGWYSASIKLTKNGKMKMFYDYANHNEDDEEYHVEWKKKYLSA